MRVAYSLTAMAHERPPHPSNRDGFSLVELLVVSAIIAIGAAIALPGIAQYTRNYAIRGAAQQVASALQQARVSAISKNVNLGVTVAVLNATQYQVVVEDDQRPQSGSTALSPPTWRTIAAEDWTVLTSIPGQAGLVQTLPNGIQFDNPANCPPPPAPLPAPGAANDWGMRFGRLGSACGVTTCAGDPRNVPASTFYVNTNGSAATVCVFQAATGLRRWVNVTTGGRVQAMR
jgi:prepilin-type N-terminal cleavage/methylation domain-containing protein